MATTPPVRRAASLRRTLPPQVSLPLSRLAETVRWNPPGTHTRTVRRSRPGQASGGSDGGKAGRPPQKDPMAWRNRGSKDSLQDAGRAIFQPGHPATRPCSGSRKRWLRRRRNRLANGNFNPSAAMRLGAFFRFATSSMGGKSRRRRHRRRGRTWRGAGRDRHCRWPDPGCGEVAIGRPRRQPAGARAGREPPLRRWFARS